MEKFQFTLEYTDNKKNYNVKDFFTKDGHLPFDTHSKEETLIMMQEIAASLQINDAYGLSRLELMLRYELPFFTTNRILVKNWVMGNFIY
ncbi:MAG: hypothetical protein IBX44_02095 [Sulfurospirillum sp.]|nr:hypothetical protein [Sulfurospirillum sp.]